MVEEVYIESHTKDLVIDGKHYRFAREKKTKLKGHMGNLEFAPVPADHEERLQKAARYLSEKSNDLTKEMIIKEVLRGMRPKELIKLEKHISKKAKPKVEKGCLALNVGGQQIWLVE